MHGKVSMETAVAAVTELSARRGDRPSSASGRHNASSASSHAPSIVAWSCNWSVWMSARPCASPSMLHCIQLSGLDQGFNHLVILVAQQRREKRGCVSD